MKLHCRIASTTSRPLIMLAAKDEGFVLTVSSAIQEYLAHGTVYPQLCEPGAA